jgi:GTP-binding protein
LRIAAEFVRSAASAADFPTDECPEVAFVGRSNVGKSSLINALTRQRIARTSGAPGKTRLVNIYRVTRGDLELYLVDLPGYGFATGGPKAAEEFDRLTRDYFARATAAPAALLLVDSRHPGMESDRAAWQWLRSAAGAAAIVATKTDKLARGQRIRAMRELESVFEHAVTPVSAVTGEGLDELWKLMDRLANRDDRNSSSRRSRKPSPMGRPAPTSPRPKAKR